MLIVVRGLPGSGKSTFAKAAFPGFLHLEADQFMVDEAGNYVFDPKKLGECHEKCLLACAKALGDGGNVVVSNTFSRQWEIEPYRGLAARFGEEYFEVMMTSQFENVHNVSKTKIAMMRERWEF